MQQTGGKWTAVIFATIMVTSMIAMPVLAASPASGTEGGDTAWNPGNGPSDGGPPGNGGDNGPPSDDSGSGNGGPPGHDRGEEANVTILDLEANSTVELLVDARTQIESQDNESEDTLREEFQKAVNESIDDYRGELFPASSQTFESQREAYRTLQELSGEIDDQESITAAEQNVQRAGNVSARIAVRDAYETVNQYEDSIDNQGQRQQTESKLGNAANALEKGEDASDAQAFVHYRNAWEQSEKAVETVEEHTEPKLSLSHGPAVETDGTFDVTVLIELDDVRAYAYEEATVTFEDGSTETVTLSGGESGLSNATGTVTVPLGETVTNQTVTVSAIHEELPDRTVEESLDIEIRQPEIIPERPDPDEYNEITVENESSGVTVDAGGDGLYDRLLSVEDYTPDESDEMEYLAGPVVRVENQTTIDEAEVTVPLAEDVDQSANLSIYTWDLSDPSGWQPVETDIDSEAGTATATVDSFSFFSVFRAEEWETHLTETIPLEDRHVVGNLTGDTTGDRVVNENDNPDGVIVGDHEWNDEGATTNEHETTASLRLEDDGGVDTNFLFEVEDDLTVDFHWRHEAGQGGSGADLAYLFNDQDSTTTGFRGFTNGIAGEGLFFRNTFGGDDIAVGGQLGDGRSFHDDQWYQIRIVLDSAENTYTVYINDGDGWEEEGVSYYDGSGFEISPEFRVMGRETGGTTEVSYDRHVWKEDAVHPPDEVESSDLILYPLNNQSVGQLKDTNDDGIPDAVAEANPLTPQAGPLVESGLNLGNPIEEEIESWYRIDIDPILEDTSGDGLADAETIDGEFRIVEKDGELKLETRVTEAKAHPGQYDTSNNGLSDYEEVKIGTDPWKADTSGDGLLDSVDPNPLEETTPPEIEYEAEAGDIIGWKASDTADDLHVTVKPTGSASQIDELQIKRFYEETCPPGSPCYGSSVDAQWDNKTIENIATSGEETVTVDFEHPALTISDNPSRFLIGAVDDKGVALAVDHKIDEDDDDEISAGAVVSGAVAQADPVRNPDNIITAGSRFVGVVGGALLVSDIYSFVQSANEVNVEGQPDVDSIKLGPLPATEPELNLPAAESPLDVEITLPSGATYEHDIEDIERSHGWEQVKRLPGINQPEEISGIIEAPNAIRDDGRFQRVIGDNPSGSGDVILNILNGIIVSASYTIEDPTGEKVEIDPTDSHPVRDDGDHISDYETVEEVIKHPDQIYQNGPNRLYVKQINGRWYTVRAYDRGIITVGTTAIYDTRDELEQFLDRKDYPNNPIYEAD